MINVLKEKFNFVLVGIVNTIITYLLYIFFLELKFNYLISFTMSWIIGFIFSFYMNLQFVFKINYNKKNQLKKKIKFFVLSLVQLFLSFFILKFVVQNFNIDERLAPLIIVIIFFLFKFLVSKFYIFNN